jgi:hypothetical protein
MLPGGSIGPHGRMSFKWAVGVIIFTGIATTLLFFVLRTAHTENETAVQEGESLVDWLYRKETKAAATNHIPSHKDGALLTENTL